MYNKNNDIGWKTKSNNNGNGSYDDTSIKKQIEKLEKEKANKDDIFTMDNMGEDVKEAMAKGDLKLSSIPGYMPQTPSNVFNPETVNTKGFINNFGELMPNDNFPHIVVSDFIEVSGGSRISVNFEGVTNWLSEYDENKNHIKHNLGNTGVVPREVILDSNTKYIRVNINTRVISLNDFYVMGLDQRDYETFDWLEKRLQEFQDSLFAPGGIATDVIASRFANMRVLVTGDSITEKNFRCNKNWHDYLKEWYGWSKVYNDGRSGSGLVKNTGIVYRLPNWKTNYGGIEDIDMILIMGNMNDGTSGETGLPEWLGSFEDQDESMKTSSLYGALHYTCQQILSMYPNIPVGFITSQPRSQVGDQGKCWGRDGWFEKWVDAINEVCGHYSIPVLDLYHNSGLRPWIAENNKKYFSCPDSPNGDGTHPNDLGQELMARKIYEFINRYM